MLMLSDYIVNCQVVSEYGVKQLDHSANFNNITL